MRLDSNIVAGKQQFPVDVVDLATWIASVQQPDGEIPGAEGDHTDPWDHVESAMGLSVAGLFHPARMAFEWLRTHQLADGAWYAAYQDGSVKDRRKDANMTSYISVGMFHYYLITKDKSFVAYMWDTVEKALDFVVGLQAPSGEIQWCVNADGQVDPMALLTGSCSIFMSLKCGLALAHIFGKKRPQWIQALTKLRHAICHYPHLFNMTKSRYSMDWFYPVLSGAMEGDAALERINKYWKKFVIEGQGVRCVSDRPWVTMAETSEFVLSLVAMGKRDLAKIVFSWIYDKRFADGTYWCGHTYPEMEIWPEDKTTWTNGVVLLALDALYGLTPGAELFHHRFWNDHRTWWSLENA